MNTFRRTARLIACLSIVSADVVSAAGGEPVLTISPAKQKALDGDYFNCDHEGSLGCLQADCKTRGGDPAEIQYLYRDVWQNFPEFLTPALRACFIRAGGRFR